MLCVYVYVCVFGTLCLRAVLDSFKAQDSLREPERWQASKQASKQTGKQEGKQEGKQAGRQAGRQEGRQVSKQASKEASTYGAISQSHAL